MANLQIQALLGQMQKTLECSICLEMMTKPVSTSCGHQFCRFCLMEFLDRKKQVPCPLCKKTITKRSLTKREQLGEMVQGVRNIITAFQKDTGALFSPPRGPQTSILPGTPESIQGKAANKGANSGRRRSNIRQTRKRQSLDINEDTDTVVELTTSERVSDTSLKHENDVTMSCKQKKKPGSKLRKAKNKKDTNVSDENVDEKRQNELLKYIAEGKHGTNTPANNTEDDSHVATVEENSASTSGIESKLSSTPLTSSSEKFEIRRASKKKSMFVAESVHVDNDMDNDDVCKGDAVKVDLIDLENDNSGPDKVVPMGCSPDDACTVLSGSIEVDSHSSSGPLFKTPVDLKGFGSKKAGIKDPVVNMKRSLRSRKEAVKYNGDDDKENDSDRSMTPEIIVIEENKIGKTYSKKDKELHIKEKKSSKKVAEWLKNLGESSVIENNLETTVNVKSGQKVKTSKKTNLKLQKEEEKMGNKMKHLAQQIQDKEKNLLFGYEDFDCDKDSVDIKEKCKDSTNDYIVIDDVNETSDDQGKVMDTFIKSAEMYESRISIVAVPETDSKVDTVCTDRSTCVGKIDEGFGNKASESNVSGDDKPKISNKKRIFKSRVQKSGSDVNKKEKVIENDSEIKKSIQDKCSNDCLDKKADSIQESHGILSCSDPYEFQSSQQTPKKTETKKAKGKKNRKIQNKNKTAVKKTAVVELIEEGNNERKFDKIWNKNLKPDKTILKNKNDLKEIYAVSVELQQAETYDLLTSTQEAADCIDKEKKKRQLHAETIEDALESTLCRKRVRFTEPTISDFVSSSHIDIISYRKAKEEFVKYTKDTLDNSNSKELYSLKVHPGKVVEQNLNKTDQNSKSGDRSQDVDINSDVVLIEDGDSSGTDDLDIEPTQDQIEKPNIDIQTEEIKAQLSQKLDKMRPLDTKNVKISPALKCNNKDQTRKSVNARPKIGKPSLDNVFVTCVAETPQIPVNKESPLVNTVAETPMIPSIPKFNKNLSKPLKILKSKRASGKSPQSSLKKESILDKDQSKINEKNFGDSSLENGVNESIIDSTDSKDQPSAQLVAKEGKSKVFKDELPFVDFKHMTNSDVPASLESTQPPDSEPVLIEESEQLCEESNAKAETDFENVCSDSLSQQSDLILHTKYSPVKPHVNEKVPDGPNHTRSHSDDVIYIDAEKTNDNTVKRKETNVGKSDESLSIGSSGSTRKIKKKRKSFMLDENEESLDFGSLNDESVESPNSDTKIVRETRRKRKRSGNFNIVEKENSQKASVKLDTIKDKSGRENIQRCEIVKENIDTSDSKEMESVDIIPDSISYSSVESELSKSRSHIVKPAADQANAKPYIKESMNENDFSSKSLKKRRDGKVESEVGVAEVTVIEETVRNSVEGSYADIEILGSEKSPKHQSSRQKKKSEENRFKKNSTKCEKGLNSSGFLVSPEETVHLSGEDGHIIVNTAMPSLDLSPGEEDTPKIESQPLEVKSPGINRYAAKRSDELKKEDSAISEIDKIVKSSDKNSPYRLKIDKVSKCGTPSKRLSDDPDSSPENKKRRSSVKAVRGFAKRKLQSQKSPVCSSHSQSPVSRCEKYKSTSNKHREFDSEISASSVRIKDVQPYEAVSNVVSCELSRNSTHPVLEKSANTPVKQITVPNISKYSPSVHKLHSKESEISTKSKEVKPEIIELRADSKEMDQDSYMLSPDELPDLDDNPPSLNETDEISNENAGILDLETDVMDEYSLPDSKKHSKPSMNMECDCNEEAYLEDKNTIPETFSPTSDVINTLSQQSNRAELDDKQDTEIDMNALKENVSLDCASVKSSSSSDFNLDSSDDESPEKEAMIVISNYNKIVNKSLEVEKGSNTSNIDLGGRNKKTSRSKCEKRQTDKHLDENAKDEVNFNAADIYSSKLDSSPIDLVAEEQNELVVLESDVEDSDNEDKISQATDKASIVESDDDSDDVLDNVIRRKGAKRAIISDSSSEDDDENSQHMNMTSSSAFSSQSENMTTQEREVLERDLEKMAAEMKAMKEQLRKCKEQAKVKDTENKDKLETSHEIVDSDEASIQDLISDDDEEDFFLSQPPFDSHNDDDVCMDVDQESKVEGTLQDDSLHTVPESQPASPAYQSVSEDERINEKDKKHEEIKRDIGIVVTGLNQSQVQGTKKLAAMNGCKFFSKFNESVTHVVVKSADDDDAMCDRTLKFFQGIANKCWIVNYFWIVDSKQNGHLLPEGPYEIQGDTANNTAHFGPKRSRLSKDNKLFSSFDIALVGDDAFLSKDSMAGLIETCGGHVLDLSKLGQGQRQSLVISCADLEEDDEQSSAVKQAKDIYKSHGLVMLTREWVLDSLTLFKMQPIQEYVITDIPNDKL